MIGIAIFSSIVVVSFIWFLFAFGCGALIHLELIGKVSEENVSGFFVFFFILAFISTVCFMAFVFDPMISSV